MQAELFNNLDCEKPVAEIDFDPTELALPNKRYHIILADPPWFYQSAQFDKERGILTSAAHFHYPTVKTEVMMTWPIQDICEDNCLLFCWTTGPKLGDSIELGKAWGFEYVTVAFVWDKIRQNVSSYTQSSTEFCQLFKKGKIPQPRGAKNVRQLHSIMRTRHSEKPHRFRKLITHMFPTQSKVELFARQRFEGWDVIGNEVPHE